MNVLDAEKTLLDLKIADWPRIKDSDRSGIINSLKSRANPKSIDEKPKQLSNADVAKLLLGK